MRFHFGISFRSRNLKKFIFPFLIGLLSYFGFSYFNLFSVYAYGNLESYYNLEVEEIDFNNESFGDYTYQDLLNIGLEDYDNYYINTLITNYGSYSMITFAVYSKNATNPLVSIYNNKGSSSGSSNSLMSYDYSYQSYYSYSIISYQSSSDIDSVIASLYDCLNNNICTNSSNMYTLPTYYYSSNINNNDNYTFNVWEKGYYYNNQLSVINRQQNTNDNWFYVKSIKVNDNIINFGDFIPTYCDLYNCSSGESSDESFDLYLSRLPYVYSNTSNLSNYNSTISFSITSDIESYKNNLYTYKFYYGRVDHGTYYTYEQLNCTSSSIANSSDTTITITTNNISCNNDLSKYDKYFVTYNFKYEDDSLPKSIYGFSSSINNGFILHNTLINYYLLDNFNNLPRGFSLLLSNNDTYNDLTTYFYSDNEYIAFDDISKNANNVVKTTNGVFYKDLAIPKKRNYGFTTNTNLLVYDDLSYSTKADTTLYMYLNPLTMVSFVDTSNNTNSYTYYDSNNNITTSTIDLIYDTIDDNTYNIDSVFQDLNNYIYDLRKDMFSVHLIMTDIYSSIPSSIRYFFNFFFSLGLIFILYKEMRDS